MPHKRSPHSHSFSPLSVLSWSVDGSLHSHHGCRRRFPFEVRSHHIVQCIRESQADVVALQDSTPQIRQLLCSEKRTPDTTRMDEAAKMSGGDITHQSHSCCSALEKDYATPAPYDCIVWAPNGRCGELQWFCRRDAAWRATPFLRGAGVSITLTPRMKERINDGTTGSGKGREVNSLSTSYSSSTSGCSNKEEGAKAPFRVVLTNVDLSYRGKSLGSHGQLLSSPYESLHGSPFSFSSSSASSKNIKSIHRTRPHGTLDVFRAMAIQYISSVNQPDILVGNFYMSKGETLPGYRDAWEVGGSPSTHERTTNTFYSHRIDKKTNYYYFLPSPRPCSVHVGKPESEPLLGSGHGILSMKDEKKAGRTDLGRSPTATREDVVTSHGTVGMTLPLSAYRRLSPASSENEGDVPSNSSSGEKKRPSAVAGSGARSASEWEWVIENRDGGHSWKPSKDQAGPNSNGTVEKSEKQGSEFVASASSCSAIGPHCEGPILSRNMALGMPEVAGRYQRCYLSLNRRNTSSRSSFFSERCAPFMKCYSSVRVIVLKPFTLEGTLSPEESSWHVNSATQKTLAKGASAGGYQKLSRPLTDAVKVTCAPSTQFPLFVQFRD